LNLS